MFRSKMYIRGTNLFYIYFWYKQHVHLLYNNNNDEDDTRRRQRHALNEMLYEKTIIISSNTDHFTSESAESIPNTTHTHRQNHLLAYFRILKSKVDVIFTFNESNKRYPFIWWDDCWSDSMTTDDCLHRRIT